MIEALSGNHLSPSRAWELVSWIVNIDMELTENWASDWTVCKEDRQLSLNLILIFESFLAASSIAVFRNGHYAVTHVLVMRLAVISLATCLGVAMIRCPPMKRDKPCYSALLMRVVVHLSIKMKRHGKTNSMLLAGSYLST